MMCLNRRSQTNPVVLENQQPGTGAGGVDVVVKQSVDSRLALPLVVDRKS